MIKLLTCHCNSVQIGVHLANGLQNLDRCNCSICSKRNAVVARIPLVNLRIIKGREFLSCYTFNTHAAKHYFCSICGIYTHHQRRANHNEFSINVACLQGVRIEDYQNVPFSDGRNNHPSDAKNR